MRIQRNANRLYITRRDIRRQGVLFTYGEAVPFGASGSRRQVIFRLTAYNDYLFSC